MVCVAHNLDFLIFCIMTSAVFLSDDNNTVMSKVIKSSIRGEMRYMWEGGGGGEKQPHLTNEL